MSQIATIGHNMPPSPFGEKASEVEKYYGEAKLWLDGEPVDSKEMAEGVSKLMDVLRQTKKAVNDCRVEEKKPFDDCAKEVQERYKPLLKKCDDAVAVCKRALTPWLEKLETEQRAAAEEKRKEAEAAARAAEEARKAAQESADLEAMEKAEALTDAAEKASKTASKADKAKAQSAGGSKAVSLRTRHVATVVDYSAAAKWLWEHRRDDMNAFIAEQIQREVNHGTRSIPGVEINVERTVQ